MNETAAAMGVRSALEHARKPAPFLRMQLDRFPNIAARLEAGDYDAALAAAHAEGEGDDVAAALRRERSAHALALAIADLAGAMPLERVAWVPAWRKYRRGPRHVQ
jgi:glutamate-ammonia-ligase adenylyltransferase